MSSKDGELREKLAAIEHERWSDWQRWMHSKFVEHSNGKGEYICLPVELFRRWERQIETPYASLSDGEKASDMEQVDRYWHLIKEYGIQERIDELERNKQKVCICDEAGINACDALWHHRNNIDQRIVELTALKDKETP